VNHGPLAFLAAFFALAISWSGYVLAPQIQIGREQPGTNIVNTTESYPQARPGLARQGLEVYRAEGCAACHTKQVEQTGTMCEVLLTDAGTNQAALMAALLKAGLGKSNPGQFLSDLPKALLQSADPDEAGRLVTALKSAGARAALRVVPVGPDIARGWGKRRSVARDYLYDDPVMVGSLRIGPDLANAGVRLPDPNWHLRHLYAPRSEVKGSMMPPYRYLFKQQKIGRQPSPDALQFLKEFAPPPGFEIVPRPEARALVAYLLSLRAQTPLWEAPLTVPGALGSPAATNTPVK
jgi:cbb3-type cytochrome oxidase cytochrome c subunit